MNEQEPAPIGLDQPQDTRYPGQRPETAQERTALQGSEIIQHWTEQSREAAQLVIDKYGEPDEGTESLLMWFDVGPWKRVLASRVFHVHNFPAPHIDSVESSSTTTFRRRRCQRWRSSTAVWSWSERPARSRRGVTTRRPTSWRST